MKDTKQMKTDSKKLISLGLLAHVDAGKTTLSEAMLYLSGSILKAGRVDKGDAFLDTHELERARGITIFSKQAVFDLCGTQITLLDTPGHVDFSAEMERTLQVLDYAVLVINGADGIQGHTKTLWKLLKRYQIPVFLFVNKMDQNGTVKESLFDEICKELSGNCVDFTNQDSEEFFENVAMCDEEVLEQYLEGTRAKQIQIKKLIKKRKLFPCYFGSALKMDGVKALIEGILDYTLESEYPAEFGAKVFKIARDAQGNRLTYLKVTGGSLKVRMLLHGKKRGNALHWEEKVNQIRIYSGEKYETVEEVSAGMVCAVTGLSETYPGEGIGKEKASEMPILEPVLTYQLILPEEINPAQMLPKLRQLEEEEPELHIVFSEATREIKVQMMGEVQIEILTSIIKERFGIEVEFGAGNILYKESITNCVEGVGHFEPLRHYAEVHLLLEPGEPGSGMVFSAACSEDTLNGNYQRQIINYLQEREFAGVLTGAPITDMKITLVSGRAHLKHTEGGDFREATYRAVRQGLMQAESILLEPYYAFQLEVPENMVGKAMTDIERMNGTLLFDGSEAANGRRILTGNAPVACMQNYQKEVLGYTKGQGTLVCTFNGYKACHNTQEVCAQTNYDPNRDTQNPASSVFCAHGAGFLVEWNFVKEYMHLESYFDKRREEVYTPERFLPPAKETSEKKSEEIWLGTDEIDRILNQTYNANKRGKDNPGKKQWKYASNSSSHANASPVIRDYTYTPQKHKQEYFLVDGYNIIFAWEELRTLAATSIDGARGRLLDILSNYQGIRKCELIVVFDAYRVAGHQTEFFDYHNIHVVYTKEAETADAYIEKYAHENGHKYKITVATSDGLEQVIIRGAGCELISARELEQEIKEKNMQMQENYESIRETSKTYLFDGIDSETIRKAGENPGKE